MKKISFFLIFLFFGSFLFADYTWDLIASLAGGDAGSAERIISQNISSMDVMERRLVMSLILNYSVGETAIRAISCLLSHNYAPTSLDLFTAINRNQQDNVVQLILDNGAAPNGEILLIAMEKQRFDFARLFIQSGADVNYSYPYSSSYADGMTALLYACHWGNLEMARLLAENGADINARTIDGRSALSIAESSGSREIYDYLLERGAAGEFSGGTTQVPGTGSGIASILGGAAFQTGVYRITAGTLELRFVGNELSGVIYYTSSGMYRSGFYSVSGSTLSLSMEGHNFNYKIDSGLSFSGNGEVWIRIGD